MANKKFGVQPGDSIVIARSDQPKISGEITNVQHSGGRKSIAHGYDGLRNKMLIGEHIDISGISLRLTAVVPKIQFEVECEDKVLRIVVTELSAARANSDMTVSTNLSVDHHVYVDFAAKGTFREIRQSYRLDAFRVLRPVTDYFRCAASVVKSHFLLLHAQRFKDSILRIGIESGLKLREQFPRDSLYISDAHHR